MSAVTAATPKVSERKPVTPAMRAQAEMILKKAKVQLGINQPFFAQIVFARPISIADNVETAYITRRGAITVGTQFMAELSVQQAVFLLAHEAMHHAMIHAFRRGPRDHRKWNYAADAVINQLLKESQVGDFIEGGVDMPSAKDKTSEKVYSELPDNPGGGKGKGKGQGAYNPGSGWDDLDDSEAMDESEAREIEEQVKVELAQAAAVAKAQGKMPAGLEKTITELVNPITPWHILLERFMTRLIQADYSFRRPNKRYIAGGLYLPSHNQLPQMGPVAIFRDTSGSCMGDDEQKHFLGHINAILEKCRPERVYVIDCDAAVHKVHELTLDDLPISPAKMSPHGGGGTSFKPPFKWIEKNDVEPEIAIYLTDMYGDFPEKAPQYPVIWLSTSEIKEAPFGEVILYRMDERQ